MTHSPRSLCGAALLAALLLCTAQAASAADRPGEVTESVTLRGVTRNPATPRAATRLLHRIGDAAMLTCGASATSLADMKQAVRASPCWRDSVAETVRRIDDPLLSAAHARHRRS
ncbi:MAG: UrcA family protein [Sphingomonas sp.]|jgi:UrcA family protein|uniref:UrcA family protein n=1 Tax=Sphingomonas sp. TaxID=28214 RepID=UPI0035677726